VTSYANHVAMHRVLDLVPIMKSEGLGPSDFLVLLGLAKRANKDGACYPSRATIASDMMLSSSSRTVSTCVKRLEEKQYLRVARSKRGNHYKLLLESHDACATNVNQTNNICTSDEQSPHKTCASDSQGSATTSHLICGACTGISKGNSKRKNEGTSNTVSSDPGEAGRGEESNFSSSVNAGITEVKPATSPAAEREYKPASSAGEELAQRFFKAQGEPRTWRDSLPDWAASFDDLLKDHTQENLSTCLTWAFEIDDFWPKKLIRGDQDPLQYFLSKIDTLLPRSIGYHKSLRNRAEQQRPASTSTTQPRSTMKWDSAI
jgi:hypothetical protein